MSLARSVGVDVEAKNKRAFKEENDQSFLKELVGYKTVLRKDIFAKIFRF